MVLSGLIQTAESGQEKRSPWISKIPLLGNLFKNKNTTQENMQMVIYLVPHITGEVSCSEHIDLEWAKDFLLIALSDYEEKCLEVGDGK